MRQAGEGLVTTNCNAAASPGSHVVIWLFDVHFLYSCLSLSVHHLELTSGIFHIRHFLHSR